MKISKPLTVEQAKKLCDENNTLIVEVDIDLNDLIDLDLEGLNDLVDDLILESGYLSGIGYKVVGHTPASDDGSGSVVIQVTAELETLF